MEEVCAKIQKSDSEKKEDEEDLEKVTDVNYLKGVQGIPDFWFRAMKNSQMIFELVKEKDEEILKNHEGYQTKIHS